MRWNQAVVTIDVSGYLNAVASHWGGLRPALSRTWPIVAVIPGGRQHS